MQRPATINATLKLLTQCTIHQLRCNSLTPLFLSVLVEFFMAIGDDLQSVVDGLHSLIETFERHMRSIFAILVVIPLIYISSLFFRFGEYRLNEELNSRTITRRTQHDMTESFIAGILQRQAWVNQTDLAFVAVYISTPSSAPKIHVLAQYSNEGLSVPISEYPIVDSGLQDRFAAHALGKTDYRFRVDTRTWALSAPILAPDGNRVIGFVSFNWRLPPKPEILEKRKIDIKILVQDIDDIAIFYWANKLYENETK